MTTKMRPFKDDFARGSARDHRTRHCTDRRAPSSCRSSAPAAACSRRDVISTADVPPFARAAMDGYAVSRRRHHRREPRGHRARCAASRRSTRDRCRGDTVGARRVHRDRHRRADARRRRRGRDGRGNRYRRRRGPGRSRRSTPRQNIGRQGADIQKGQTSCSPGRCSTRAASERSRPSA